MATQQTTEQTNQNSGQGAGTVGQGVGRDVNISASLLGIGDIMPDLSNLGASTATSTSGAVTVGDRIMGGEKRQFGLVKILAIVAGVAIFIKLLKKKGK